jgi:Domain of unknown function (DUF4365)
MATKDPWFIEERAIAFASLLLTARNDVMIRNHTGSDRAIDLLVEVLKDGKPTLRFFGVQLAGYLDLPDNLNGEKRGLTQLPGNALEGSLPVCVFVIGVRKPEGMYRWVVEPVVEDGRALLHQEGMPNWQALDEEGVGRIISQVNAWYDTFQANSMPKRRDRQAKAGS